MALNQQIYSRSECQPRPLNCGRFLLKDYEAEFVAPTEPHLPSTENFTGFRVGSMSHDRRFRTRLNWSTNSAVDPDFPFVYGIKRFDCCTNNLSVTLHINRFRIGHKGLM